MDCIEVKNLIEKINDFRWTATPAVMNKIFGPAGGFVWQEFVRARYDIMALYGYLDEGHQELFVKYLIEAQQPTR